MHMIVRAIRLTVAGVVMAATAVAAQVTTPRQALGFNIGDDYHLATYDQFEAYWKTLASESPRMVLEQIGQTEEGRSQWMAIITSPENHRNLRRYQGIARRLALAEGLTDAEARALAREGKAVVWIDGGLHATEVLGAHQLMQFVYEMVSRNDEETLRFLSDVIVLAVHANPDGMQLVSEWYMRHDDPMQRSTSGIPRLYQKYVGHDNNRDFYMSTQSETINMNRIMYREWFPQIVYNHHQTGPAGSVMFAPPFRDPFNYNYDPLVPLGIEAVGTAMHTRMVAEGKGGTTSRTGASYSTWWNGGLRTTPYFHNMIGLLTETIGNPTPVEVPFIPDRQLPHNDQPLPVEPGQWHFIQSIEYSQTANRAVLNYASRNREDLLFNIYRMGSNAIARGNTDTWTTHPQLINAAKEAAGQGGRGANAGGGGFGRNRGVSLEVYRDVLRNPDNRDPRGYILSANQADFPTATKFVNTLIRNGITVHRATREFSVNGTAYPAGSYVVKTAQAFAPFVFDLFEPQDHPDDFEYPGGPPISPYDNTGWTVSYQMGIAVDRILTGFDGPFEVIEGEATPPAGMIASANGARGFLMRHEQNDGFVLTNRLLAGGEKVFWLREAHTVDGRTWPAGTVYIPASNGSRREVNRAATELGISFQGVRSGPAVSAFEIRPVRVGLWDEYGGSMPSGWARWVMEQFEFPFEVVYPPRLDAGNLRDQFDVLIFVNGAIAAEGSGGGGFGGPRDRASIPAEFQDRLGDVTGETTVPQLRRFLEQGGSVITIGNSTSLGNYLGLGLENHLLGEDGRPLGRDEYFVPGSILQVRIDNTQPVTYGLPRDVDVHFNNSPVFVRPGGNPNITTLGWFASGRPLRSGWAWGQDALEGGVTMMQAAIGDGTLYLFGPEVIRRGQPHGTFKFLFNGILLANRRAVSAP